MSFLVTFSAKRCCWVGLGNEGENNMALAEERNTRTWRKNKEDWGYNNANEEIMAQEEVSEVRMGPIVQLLSVMTS